MIVTALMALARTMISSLLDMLPAWNFAYLPADVGMLMGVISQYDNFGPFTEAMQVFAALIPLWYGGTILKIILLCVDWITNVIP